MEYTQILLRYGELFLKGKNRLFFENKLTSNINKLIGIKAQRIQGRLIMPYFPEHVKLKQVFGLTSYSLAIKTEKDKDERKLNNVEAIGAYMAGRFDGDGCITIKKGRGKYGQQILKGIAVIFTSGSKEFLEGLKNSANRFANFRKRNVYYIGSSRAYYLKYDTLESLKWFKYFYKDNLSGLFLKRKLDVFKKYFQLRPIRIDEEIENILNKEYGRVSK